MYAIGLMSGTSLDGVDAVLCEVQGVNESTTIREVSFATTELPDDIKEKVQLCSINQATPAMMCSLNVELGEIFAQAALQVMEQAGMKPEDITFIASHGQTLYHIPFSTEDYSASTLQMGEPAVIAWKTKVPVISSFRAMDMAAGGQGAPLVPFSELVIYGQSGKNTALQNLGGIGNVTVLSENGSIDEIFAFDTGPGNMMIDEAMKALFHMPYDDQGKTAAKGKLIPELAEELADHPYLKLVPPKSTGRELFGREYVQSLLDRYGSEAPEDLVHTLTWFTAYCMFQSYRDFILNEHPLDEIILAGGGAHNQTIRQLLQQMLPDIPVLSQEEKGYSSDAKEAIAFVILGNQTWHHLPSNVPSATGAGENVILGSITWP